jgi:hypothetical protein
MHTRTHASTPALSHNSQVLALARPSTDTAPLEARAAAAAPGGAALLSIARVDLSSPGAGAAVCAALMAAAAGSPATPRPLALINVVGVRDLAVPDAAIRSVLTHGTRALWGGCVSSGRVSRFVSIAGGIHRTAGGAPNRTMVHNAAREDALEVAAAEARAGWEAGEGRGQPPTTPSLTILDPSVYFKDAASIFSMIARKSPPSLTLIEGGWGVRCAPISGRDLAGALLGAALGPPQRPPAAVTRFSVGGPQVVTFGELADAAASALAGVQGSACRRVTLPRWAAQAAWTAASMLGAAGSKKALGLARLLSFLWVVCTDESPGGLVGEVRVGQDTVSDLFAELAGRMGERRG